MSSPTTAKSWIFRGRFILPADFPEIESGVRLVRVTEAHVAGPGGDPCFELSVQSLFPWTT